MKIKNLLENIYTRLKGHIASDGPFTIDLGRRANVEVLMAFRGALKVIGERPVINDAQLEAEEWIKELNREGL